MLLAFTTMYNPTRTALNCLQTPLSSVLDPRFSPRRGNRHGPVGRLLRQVSRREDAGRPCLLVHTVPPAGVVLSYDGNDVALRGGGTGVRESVVRGGGEELWKG